MNMQDNSLLDHGGINYMEGTLLSAYLFTPTWYVIAIVSALCHSGIMSSQSPFMIASAPSMCLYFHGITIGRLLGQLIHSYIVNIRDFSTGTRLNHLMLPVKKTPGMAV